jgi:8-oxo-dGTP pyrophosphatase MutT (NUDIX family)
VLLATARAKLRDYRPSDEREQAYRERLLALLDTEAPCSRRQFEPGHLTASAFVLAPEGDALLLILHKKLGIWVQPGGHIEPEDASLEAAARREAVEEVGVELDAAEASAIFDIDIHDIPARKGEAPHQHFDVRFRFRATTRALTGSDEVTSSCWVELSQVERLTTDESVLRAVRKIMAERPGSSAP